MLHVMHIFKNNYIRSISAVQRHWNSEWIFKTWVIQADETAYISLIRKARTVCTYTILPIFKNNGFIDFILNNYYITTAKLRSLSITFSSVVMFRLLPVSNLIDIRTARFVEEFIINENHVCTLFVRNAQCSLAKIFSMYSRDIVSTCNLKSFIRDVFSDDIIMYLMFI